MGGLLVMFACFRVYCQFLSPEFPSLNLGYPIVWYKESGGLRRPRRLRGWSDTSSSSPSRVCESCVSCDGPWHQLHSFILETTVLRPGSISEANFCCCWGREILRQKDFWQRKNGLVLPKAVENHWLVRLIQDVPLSITKHLEKMIQFRKVTSIPALKINCPASLVMLMQKQLLLVFCINLFFSTLLTLSAEWRKCQRIKGPNPRTQKATTLESPPLVPFCCWLDWRHFTRKSLEKSAAFRLLRQPPTQTSCVLTHGSMWYWKPPNEFARAELMTHTITVGQAWKQPWHRFGIGTSELTNSAHTLERPKNSWIPKLFHLSKVWNWRQLALS